MPEVKLLLLSVDGKDVNDGYYNPIVSCGDRNARPILLDYLFRDNWTLSEDFYMAGTMQV